MCVIVLLDEHHIFSEQYRILQYSYEVIHMNLPGPVSDIRGSPEFKFVMVPIWFFYSSDWAAHTEKGSLCHIYLQTI